MISQNNVLKVFFVGFILMSNSLSMENNQKDPISDLREYLYKYCDQMDAMDERFIVTENSDYLNPVAQYFQTVGTVFDRSHLEESIKNVVLMLIFGASGDERILKVLTSYTFNHLYVNNRGDTCFSNPCENIRVLFSPLGIDIPFYKQPQLQPYLNDFGNCISLSSFSNGYIKNDIKFDVPQLIDMFLFLIEELSKNKSIWKNKNVGEFIIALHAKLTGLQFENLILPPSLSLMSLKYKLIQGGIIHLYFQEWNQDNKNYFPQEIIQIIMSNLAQLDFGLRDLSVFSSSLLSPEQIFDHLAGNKIEEIKHPDEIKIVNGVKNNETKKRSWSKRAAKSFKSAFKR